jgi:hypothetical protein
MSSFQSYRVSPKPKPVAPKPVKGLKRALLIGINYIGTPYALAGCINDAVNMSAQLRTFFPMCSEYRLLTDNTPLKPTRKNILDSINWLVTGLKPGENVFFHYSGHGGIVRDMNGDEVSGLDSCIYPVNGKTIETIIDDEIRTLLANKIPAGSKCFVVLDSCHSGTAVDLRYSWKVASPTSSAYDEYTSHQKTAGQVIFLSGCRDNQTAVDTADGGGKPCGALTWALLETWKKYGAAIKPKYVLWDTNMFLATKGYTQRPQMTCGIYVDINTVFDLGK